ncbi:hypothetical protein [Sphingobacterium corticibacterium]|uniref:DUF304 domain-containing protein n=1 Tax=Sphingobacterium corticibacterium TaxID=2484746 RepID=A0A4Q6XDL3_9SPHI|nr:hypothetical protein [Sphingobacterium corticibacterium]RZF57871.1 hypothetical protein EWE74_19560 [Sphingobacterium corticibacterium]
MEANTKTIRISKKEKNALVLRIILIWFFMYFPFINFVEDYLLLSKPIGVAFFILLLIIIYAIVSLFLLISRLFSSWVIKILPEGVRLKFFWGTHFFRYLDIKSVTLSYPNARRRALQFTLSKEADLSGVFKPIRKLYIKKDGNGNPYILVGLTGLDVDAESLMNLIVSSLHDSESSTNNSV